MNSEEGGVSLLRRRPRREASGVLPRIPCIGLTFFPPSLPLRPPSSVLLSFLSRHWTENVLVCGPRKPRKRGRPTAIRRGKGRCRKRRGKRREGGREEGGNVGKDGGGRGDNNKSEVKIPPSSRSTTRSSLSVQFRWLRRRRRRRPKCETEALSDISDCNCSRGGRREGGNTPHYRKY